MRFLVSCLILVLGSPSLISGDQERAIYRLFHHGRYFGGNVHLVEHSTQSLPPDQWFEQVLDHFNPTDNRTWKQRYYTNSTFYKPGGPVFLMIGGEGEATASWMVQGQWIEDAEYFHALCFQLEHRFYGKSHPTADLSVDNLMYLNSEQALADLAYFIEAMNEQHHLPAGTKWIVQGGSYPGSLAAWMRARYPHLVHGAMSASGPLLAEFDFKDFFVVVQDALEEYNPKCTEAIKTGFAHVEVLLRHMIGQRQIEKLFKTCDPITNKDLDIQSLFENLASNFAGVVQYNKDNRPKSPTYNITIDVVCDLMMTETSGTPVERLAAVNSLLLDAAKQKCLDYTYENMVKQYSDVSWNSSIAEGGRQWLYQTCVEFGFFQTSSSKAEIFGDKFPVEFFSRQCADIFGLDFSDDRILNGIKRTNILYGALDIQASRIVFAHGTTDPWHALGITKTLRRNAPAILIKDTAHCAVMYPSRSEDPPQLISARKKIRYLIQNWLKEE